MVNIFSNPDTIDFWLTNNTNSHLKLHPESLDVLSPATLVGPVKLTTLVPFCKFKEYYLQNAIVQSWFDSGMISYTLITSPGGINCPFENTGGTFTVPVSDTPPSSPTAGSMWIRNVDKTLFIYDNNRSKWLSSNTIKISASRNFNNVTNQYLMSDEGIYTNQDPFVYTDNLTLVKIIAKSTTNGNWILRLKNNDLDTDIAVFNVNNGLLLDNSINIDLNANTNMSFYLDGSNVGFPNVDLIARYRG
jgi:hypothetical protein